MSQGMEIALFGSSRSSARWNRFGLARSFPARALAEHTCEQRARRVEAALEGVELPLPTLETPA